jgi:hypothetical protein
MKRGQLFIGIVVMALSGLSALGQVTQPSVVMLAPDLTFGKILRKNISVVEILVVNQGKVKSPLAEGGFNCIDIEFSNGVKLGSTGFLAIKQLHPGETLKVKMDCGKGRKITGAGLDGKKQVQESNEKNNWLEF